MSIRYFFFNELFWLFFFLFCLAFSSGVVVVVGVERRVSFPLSLGSSFFFFFVF